MKRLITPLTGADVEDLRVGDRLLLSGKVYTAGMRLTKGSLTSSSRTEPLRSISKARSFIISGRTPARPKQSSVLPGRPPATGWIPTRRRYWPWGLSA